MLYSYKGSLPAPLPFRITLPNGFTRTDPSTFTPEEIALAGYTGPYTEPPYNPNTQVLEWVNGAYVVRNLPPPPPKPEWGTFKSTLLADSRVNSALSAALPIVPSAVLSLPASLMAVAQGQDPADFYAAWDVLINNNLISRALLQSIVDLATTCKLPSDFIGRINLPLA